MEQRLHCYPSHQQCQNEPSVSRPQIPSITKRDIYYTTANKQTNYLRERLTLAESLLFLICAFGNVKKNTTLQDKFSSGKFPKRVSKINLTIHVVMRLLRAGHASDHNNKRLVQKNGKVH